MIEACIGQSLGLDYLAGLDITGHSSITLSIRDPLGVEHEYTGTSATPSTGALSADIPAGDLGTAGEWATMWEITLGDEVLKTVHGEPIKVLNEYE